MKFLNFNKVICISPHPDDVELGMLGTILKYQNTKFDILCLTVCGAKGFDNSDKLCRENEVKELWKNANCKNVNCLYSDVKYFEDKTEPEWINYIENNFLLKNNYDCLFIPTVKDSMFEHRFVNKFGYALIRHLPMSLIEYRTVSTLNTWTPNIFIDIEEENYKKKIMLLQYFKSQLYKIYFKESVLLSVHTNTQCCKKGINFSESYNLKELLI